MQDLTAFVAQFLLLVGLLGAVIHNVADERHLVERDGARHLGGFREVDGVAAEHELVGALASFISCSTPARPAPDTAW